MKIIHRVLISVAILFSSTVNAQNLTRIDALRSGVVASDTVFISDAGKEGLFYYDAQDTVSRDNTGTVIVSSNGRRYKRSFSGALNAKWFGLKEGLSAENALAVNHAIAAMKTDQELLIEAGNYYFNGPIILPKNKKINFTALGTLYFGNNDGIIIEKTHNVRIESIVGVSWTGENVDNLNDFVGSGITIKNGFHSNISVQNVSGFRHAIFIKGVMSDGNVGGSQYNKIQFAYLDRNKIGIFMTTDDSGENWVNENTFTGGRIRGETGLLTVKGAQQSDPFNGNKFYNIGFEQLVNGIDASFFANNNIIAPRFEQVSNGINLRSDSWDNIIIGSSLYESTFVSGGQHEGKTASGTAFFGKLLTRGGMVAGDIHLANRAGKFTSINVAPDANTSAESSSTLLSISNLLNVRP